jgi:formamidopyrimidine-DNA glycosylase
MPELPDVEIFKNYLNEHALGQKITGVEVLEKKSIRGHSPKELEKVVVNDSFDSAERYGKWLLIHTHKGNWLAMHFGMTGELEYLEDGRMPSSVRVVFQMEEEHKLVFADRRKLGGIELIKDKEELIEKHHLGPDAMDVSFKEFKLALAGKKGKIKSILMDQSVIAGIGNVYADEVLFQAKIHPESSVAHMEEVHLKKIYSSIQPVLKTAINHHGERGNMPEGYLLPHRKEGEKCPHCKGNVELIEVGGRSTYFCPTCQKKL